MGLGINGEKPYEKIEIPAAKPEVPKAPSKERVLGLDVAKYQDKMDSVEWIEAWKRGYRFVFAKCTDGQGGKDAYYQLHRRLSKQEGFLFGAYHFFRFGYDPQVQAEHFFKSAGRVSGELPPVLDVEWDRYTMDQRYGEGKRMDTWAEGRVRQCAEYIYQLFGVRPIIYTNAYFWPEKASFPGLWVDHKCWIPSYADSLKPSGDKVKVPPPWKQWNFWQDSDDLSLGDVKAIDTNVFRGSIEDLRGMCK